MARWAMADQAAGGTLTEMQARMFGQAIVVAAHGPASVALLDKIDVEFGVGKLLRDTGVVVESWNAGGCHVFAMALCNWINRHAEKVSQVAAPVVYADAGRMIHVVTSWRGWLFDDRGAWSLDEFLLCYDREYDGEVIPYVASKYTKASLPRKRSYAKSLESIFEASLLSPEEWIPDARGFVFGGQRIIYDRIERLLAKPRRAETESSAAATKRKVDRK